VQNESITKSPRHRPRKRVLHFAKNEISGSKHANGDVYYNFANPTKLRPRNPKRSLHAAPQCPARPFTIHHSMVTLPHLYYKFAEPAKPLPFDDGRFTVFGQLAPVQGSGPGQTSDSQSPDRCLHPAPGGGRLPQTRPSQDAPRNVFYIPEEFKKQTSNCPPAHLHYIFAEPAKPVRRFTIHDLRFTLSPVLQLPKTHQTVRRFTIYHLRFTEIPVYYENAKSPILHSARFKTATHRHQNPSTSRESR